MGSCMQEVTRQRVVNIVSILTRLSHTWASFGHLCTKNCVQLAKLGCCPQEKSPATSMVQF